MRYATRCLQFVTVGALAFALSREAQANGRYPRGEYLKESVSDPNSLVLSATYGMLVTADRGKNWFLACERAVFGVAPNALEFIDPVFERTASGALFSASWKAFRVSRDGACSFATQTALPYDKSWYDPSQTRDPAYIVDLTAEVAKGDKAFLVLVDNGPLSPGLQLHESLDDGATWNPLGQVIPRSLVFSAQTLDVAPSDAKRIYVSAQSKTGSSILVVSSDAGATWSSTDILTTGEGASYIAAVAPSDPNALYVRSDIWLPDPDTGGQIAEDRLQYTKDAGKSWTEVLRRKGKLLGFALSPDGKTVLAGFGDPVDPDGRHVDEADLGIYRADAGTSNFTKIYDAGISCLTWNKTGLYACTKQDRDGFHLGFAKDASFDLTKKDALEQLLRLPDVKGPLPWLAGSAGGVCGTDWTGMPPDKSGVCSAFGACRDGGADPAPLCGLGSDAGSGKAGAGGAGGSDGGSSGWGGVSGSLGNDTPQDNACKCSVPGAPVRTRAGAWSLVLVGLALLQRRVRRSV